jgi:hypothetical protein
VKREKKKTSPQTQQKLQAAQQKKIFLERLRKFCALISDDEPLFNLLPQKALDVIYEYRSLAIKIKVADGTKITKRFVRIMYQHMDEEMKEKRIDIVMGDVKKSVDMVEYYQVVFPLETVLLWNIYPFRGQEKFNVFCTDAKERSTTFGQQLAGIIHYGCYAYSNLGTQTLYTFVLDVKWAVRRLSQVITLGTYALDMRYVEINGDRRPVVQVGEILHNNGVSTLIPTVVPVERLQLDKKMEGVRELPVYVQQHAINRSMQRACYLYPGSVTSAIDKAFTYERKIIRDGDKFLVECYEYEFKIGYFVARIIDGLFVIITFLLITHSSTPEGKKLSQLTGLQRDDFTFLAIDDLKTLLNSDIRLDSRISKIFTEAGCKSILDMNLEVSKGDFDWLRDEKKQSSELSKLIAEYIQLGDEDDDYFENE